MRKFVTEEMKGCNVLEQGLSLKSTLGPKKAAELNAFADAIAASVKG